MPAIVIQILEACVVPLLGVLTAFLISWIKAKTAELQEKTDNEMLQKYLGMLAETITDCVAATTQTYVDNLKVENAFTAEAQAAAFEATKEAVLNILSDEAKDYLAAIYGDLNILIANKIEAEVKIQKMPAA